MMVENRFARFEPEVVSGEWRWRTVSGEEKVGGSRGAHSSPSGLALQPGPLFQASDEGQKQTLGALVDYAKEGHCEGGWRSVQRLFPRYCSPLIASLDLSIPHSRSHLLPPLPKPSLQVYLPILSHDSLDLFDLQPHQESFLRSYCPFSRPTSLSS
jgi:hypothetical protein